MDSLISVCEKFKVIFDFRLKLVNDVFQVPIIADEIYAGMVFPGRIFFSFAEISSTVPIIVCGGISKRFLVPGWRMGW